MKHSEIECTKMKMKKDGSGWIVDGGERRRKKRSFRERRRRELNDAVWSRAGRKGQNAAWDERLRPPRRPREGCVRFTGDMFKEEYSVEECSCCLSCLDLTWT